jgi:hypothetical protein
LSHAAPHPLLAPEQVTIPAGNPWTRLPAVGIALALAGGVVLVLLGRGRPAEALASWLVAFAFFLTIALGCLFFVLTQFAAKAGWSVVLRRIAENAMATLPLFAVLAVPILAWPEELYAWARDGGAHDALLEWKRPYLNTGFFTARAVAYLAVWSALALVFARASLRQDRTGDPAITRRLQALAGPGILLFAVTVTFASVDWLMSLEPHWYSTIFGVYWFAGSLVGAFAFLALVLAGLQRAGLMRRLLAIDHFHDVGKLLFSMTVFWSYIAFSQYFLIWYANLPEETVWYAARTHGTWRTASQVLAVGHFAVPFLFLLPTDVKRRPIPLAAGAVWMLAMHYLDLYWVVMPTHHPGGVSFSVLDLAALAAVGGVFLAGFGLLLRRGALVPHRDPRLAESLTYSA